MCLIAMGKVKRTTEPMTVFKVVHTRDGKFVSVVLLEPYELGVTKKVFRFGTSSKWPVFRIRRGIEIHKGIHSFRTLQDAKLSGYFYSSILECEIPIGTKYVEGRHNEIASLALTPIRVAYTK